MQDDTVIGASVGASSIDTSLEEEYWFQLDMHRCIPHVKMSTRWDPKSLAMLSLIWEVYGVPLHRISTQSYTRSVARHSHLQHGILEVPTWDFGDPWPSMWNFVLAAHAHQPIN